MNDPELSFMLIGYLAWPNQQERRDSWMATNLYRFAEKSRKKSEKKVEKADRRFNEFGGAIAVAHAAFTQQCHLLEPMQQIWPRVADIFQGVVDMAHATDESIREGASLMKSYDMVECWPTLPGRSQLENAWREYKDVAHLIVAAAHIAHVGAGRSPACSSSLLAATLLAPEAVLALAAGYEKFGLEFVAQSQKASLLRPNLLWRVPVAVAPENLFIPHRKLTDEQIRFLTEERTVRGRKTPESSGSSLPI